MPVWLLALAAPLAYRVMAAIGIGWITYVGVDAVLALFISQVTGIVSGIGGAAGQIAAMMGLFDALGITLGAISTRYSLALFTRLAKL